MKTGAQRFEFHIIVEIERPDHSSAVRCMVRGQQTISHARFDTFSEAENFAAEQARIIMRDEK